MRSLRGPQKGPIPNSALASFFLPCGRRVGLRGACEWKILNMRDLPLPIKLLPVEPEPAGSLCRKVRRRVKRRCNRAQCYNEAAAALNDLFGVTEAADAGVSPVPVNAVVMQAASVVFPSFDSDEALQALLGSSAYCSDIGVGSLASYQPDNISLPTDQSQGVPLHSVLPPHPTKQLSNFGSEMLLEDEEFDGEVYEHGLAGLYTDPILKNSPKRYKQFLVSLFKCGLLKFKKTQDVKSHVGIFFVKKKSGKLRLILDCRRTNQYFRTPPSGATTGLGALGEIRVPEGEVLYGASYDIKDMFYRLSVPEALQLYFGLPSIGAAEARELFGDAVPSDFGDCDISPVFCMLPMGFSWSFYFAQEVLRFAIKETLPESEFLVDRSPVNALTYDSSLALAYADNGYHFALDRERASRAAQEVQAFLKKAWTLHSRRVRR